MNIINVINRLAPNANENYLGAIRGRETLFQEYEITTPLRVAHFFAQALHETGGFTILRENMNYTSARLLEIFGVNRHSAAITSSEAETLAHKPEDIAERVYGLGNPRKARELGNRMPGDGYRYRGNGVLQTTGRTNHRRMGDACGLDFEANPDLLTSPEHALKPALQEWREGNLNEAADRNDITAITKKINGGFNGLSEREALFGRIWTFVKSEDHPEEPWRAGREDDRIAWLQQALNDLGADPELIVDGRSGPATRKAIRAFQVAAGIPADGVAGPVTEAAIRLRLEKLR